MGRRTRLSPSRMERLLDALREGNRRGIAARLAGVSEPTFYRWMADRRPPFRQFRESVELAEAEAEATAVKTLRKAMLRNPRVAMWFLENRSPEWRQYRLIPAPIVDPPASLPERLTQVIVVTAEQLREMGMQKLGPIAQPTAEERAGLVEDYYNGEPVDPSRRP
jgi:predicted DNA-binding transcriptional regulator AlpA